MVLQTILFVCGLRTCLCLQSDIFSLSGGGNTCLLFGTNVFCGFGQILEVQIGANEVGRLHSSLTEPSEQIHLHAA